MQTGSDSSLVFIDTEGLEVLGKGIGGIVYKLNDEQILKVFFEKRSLESFEKMFSDARTAFIHGIPTEISFGVALTKDGIGIIYERLAYDLLAQRIHADPENISKYAGMMVETSRKLSSVDMAYTGLKSYKEEIRSDLSNVDEFLPSDTVKLINEYLDVIPERFTCVHGDYHASNIILMGDEVTLIDMDDFGYGHPVWDLASLVPVYQVLPNDKYFVRSVLEVPSGIRHEDFFLKLHNLSVNEANELFRSFMDICFEGVSQSQKKNYLRLIRLYADILLIRYINLFAHREGECGEKIEGKKAFLHKYEHELRSYDISNVKEMFAGWSF